MKKTLQLITDEIIASLREFKDEKRRKMAKSNHPTQLEIIGVTNPNLKKVLAELRSILKNWSNDEKKALIFNQNLKMVRSTLLPPCASSALRVKFDN